MAASQATGRCKRVSTRRLSWPCAAPPRTAANLFLYHWNDKRQAATSTVSGNVDGDPGSAGVLPASAVASWLPAIRQERRAEHMPWLKCSRVAREDRDR